MIVRSKRSQSRLRGEEHRHFEARIDDLQHENKSLRMELLQLEQRLQQSESSKKKYKAKYRDAKQKLEILTMIGHTAPHHSLNDPYQLCTSPRTKTTRIRTISEEEFQSLRACQVTSEFASQGETKVEEGEMRSSKRCVTAASTMKEIEGEGRGSEKGEEGTRILDHLLQLQRQLEALSLRIESRTGTESRVVQLEGQLYQRMQEVSEKITSMETRDIERENRRVSFEREKSARRFNSSMKAVERIGKGLVGFKVDREQ